jgi:hypothetical protein
LGAMARLLLIWDPEIDGAFRRRLERALAELRLDFADAAGVDPDPEAPAPLKIAIASARGFAAPASDLLVLGGPGEFADTSRAFRLDTPDIESGSRRWAAFTGEIAKKLGRAALVVSPEELAVDLDKAVKRAGEAERMRDEFELQRNNALRAQKHAEAELASAQAHIANLEQNVERLTALAESTAFSLSSVRDDLRAVVTAARDHAWQARRASARAAEMAGLHPDALAWPKANASYSGETRNKLPHGLGVIVFRRGTEEIGRYSGQFSDGVRAGHGIAVSGDGMVWTGEMKDGEACGFGVLETPKGQRFEGEVAADADGAPRQVRGHGWDTRPAARLTPGIVRPAALPAPKAAG